MNKTRLFYFLSFLEGGSVMAAELLGAKMLSPYFGTSLYVWSAVLAVTLGGLAIGYFIGGIISERRETERNLYYVLLGSAVFLMLMPLMAKEVMIHTARFDLLVSILISSVVFLFPPVFFMGMVSPIIVQCLALAQAENSVNKNPGKAAGTVYAISTVGGILATFLLGFYIIPNFGLTIPAIVIGILLGVIPFVSLIRSKKFFSFIFLLFSAWAVFFSLCSLRSLNPDSDIKILYSSEGLLGQIIVADYPLYEGTQKVDGTQRILFVNRSTQTIVTTRNGQKSFFEYVNLISGYVQGPHWHSGSRALVLGLGGGSVVSELVKNNFEVDVVELDVRMADVVKKYFDLPAKANIHIDDARHFVKNEPAFKKYDLILLDAFIGEVNPHHLFTKEFFGEIKSLLSDSGVFFINANGYWNGSTGKGTRSICKTLIHSGFNVDVVPTEDNEDYRNLVFISRRSVNETGAAAIDRVAGSDLQDAVILTDEKPQLEVLNAEANMRWRKACMQYFLNGYYSHRDMLLFK